MLPGNGKNQWGETNNFKVSESYLEKLGFKRMHKEEGRCFAYPSRYGVIVITILEGTRVHLRGMAQGMVLKTGKFNGNCKDEGEFLDRLEFLTLL